MPPVLLRTNFMDRKARDFFFHDAAYQSNPLCLVARTRTSDAPEQKMFPQLQEWQRRPSRHRPTGKRNTRAKPNYMMNSGRELQRTFQMPNSVAQTGPRWQTRR